jgi:hypothetical protein
MKRFHTPGDQTMQPYPQTPRSSLTARLSAPLAASVLAASAFSAVAGLMNPAIASSAVRAHVHPQAHGHGQDGGYWPNAAPTGRSTAVIGSSAPSAQLSCLTPGAAAAGITLKTPLPASQAPAKAEEAVNRLRLGTLVQFDARVRTVGEAMVSLLAPARYRITNRTVDPAASAAVMRRPLPVAARDAGLMSIEKGLLLLIGDDHRLVVDHRNRHVAVERIPLGEGAASLRMTAARP